MKWFAILEDGDPVYYFLGSFCLFVRVTWRRQNRMVCISIPKFYECFFYRIRVCERVLDCEVLKLQSSAVMEHGALGMEARLRLSCTPAKIIEVPTDSGAVVSANRKQTVTALHPLFWKRQA